MTDLLNPLRALAEEPIDPLEGLLDLAEEVVAKRSTASVEDVNVDELQVDHDYQRPPDRDKVAGMAETLRTGGRLKPIKVNRRPDGSMWITDGQHRWIAAQEAGHKTLRAHVTDLPSQAEPAQTNLVAKQAAAVAAHRNR